MNGSHTSPKGRSIIFASRSEAKMIGWGPFTREIAALGPHPAAYGGHPRPFGGGMKLVARPQLNPAELMEAQS